MARWKLPKALLTLLPPPAPLPKVLPMPLLLATLLPRPTRPLKLPTLPRKRPTLPRARWKKPRSKLFAGQIGRLNNGGRRFAGGPFVYVGSDASQADKSYGLPSP